MLHIRWEASNHNTHHRNAGPENKLVKKSDLSKTRRQRFGQNLVATAIKI